MSKFDLNEYVRNTFLGDQTVMSLFCYPRGKFNEPCSSLEVK